MRKPITTAILTSTTLLALLVAVPAQASPIYVKGAGLGISDLFMIGPQRWQGFAGQILVDTGVEGTSDDFAVYCVDASRSRTAVEDVTIRPLSQLPDNGNPAGVQADAGARIAWLLNHYGTTAWLATDGNNRAAALQLAIWEVLYDPLGSYDISTGHFFLVYSDLYAGSYPSLVTYTNQYFASLGSNTAEAIWLDVSDPALTTGQDFARPIPNPEPASILLFGTGLLGLARATWRRRRQ